MFATNLPHKRRRNIETFHLTVHVGKFCMVHQFANAWLQLALLSSCTEAHRILPPLSRSVMCLHALSVPRAKRINGMCTTDTNTPIRPSDALHSFMLRMSPLHETAVEMAVKSIRSAIEETTHTDASINMRFNFNVTSRVKSITSTWMKIQLLGCTVDDIMDLVAIRIIISGAAQPNASPLTETEGESMCYELIGAVHRSCHPVPSTFKDYIAFPKPNGYQSLHTTVLVGAQPVEIQIRTAQMHESAESGTASHVLYKEEQRTRLNDQCIIYQL